MAKSRTIQEWINGHILSVFTDDNLNDTYRAEVYLFDSENRGDSGVFLGGTRSLTHTAELIKKAELLAQNKKGYVEAFKVRMF